jgi:peptide/nickel transport system permease protein
MLAFFARRLFAALALVAVVSSAALILTQLAPGDATTELVGSGASASAIAAERARLGLDRPAWQQFSAWASRAARLDFGRSVMYSRPVAGLVVERAVNTAILAFVALALATAVGIPLGVLAGSRRNVLSALIRGISVFFLSMPSLVSSLVLVFIAARTGWLPAGGMSSLADASGATTFARALDLARHLAVPALALALPLTATLERLQAGAVTVVLGEPYITAARARGVPPSRLLWRHAFVPSAHPVVSIYGLILGSLLSGSFIVEIVTAWPGLGRLMFDALRSRDLYLVAGCAAAGAVFLSAGALLSDLGLVAFDPRLRSRVKEAS